MALKKIKTKKPKTKPKAKTKAKSKLTVSQNQNNIQSVNVNVKAFQPKTKPKQTRKKTNTDVTTPFKPSLPNSWIFDSHRTQAHDNDAIRNELKEIKNYVTHGMLSNNNQGFYNDQEHIGFGSNGVSYDNRIRILPSDKAYTNIGSTEPKTMFDKDEEDHSKKVKSLLNKRAKSKHSSQNDNIFINEESDSFKSSPKSKQTIFPGSKKSTSTSSVEDVPMGTYCDICKTYILRERDMPRHLTSKKHQKNLLKQNKI